MKILHVMHRFWPYPGGAETYIGEFSKRFIADGQQVSVWTTDAFSIESFQRRDRLRIDNRQELIEGIKVRRFPSIVLPRHNWLMKQISRIPSKFCKNLFDWPYLFLSSFIKAAYTSKEPFDLIAAGAFPYDAPIWLAQYMAAKRKIPFVCIPLLHAGEPRNPQIIKHYLTSQRVKMLKAADAVVILTEMELKPLLKKGIPREKIHVIGAGVDPERVKGGDGNRFRKKYHFGSEPLVVQVSTQSHDKGSQHLVEAMKLLWRKGYDVKLVLAGTVLDDFDRYFIQQDAETIKRTAVLGHLSQKDLCDLYAAADIFAMPSRAETFGIVYLEAWLYKKPVIGAYAGGVPAIIKDGVDGLLAPFADIHILSELLAKLIKDKDLGKRLGENGYQKVIKHFSWEETFIKIKKLYTNLVNRDL